MNESQMQAFEEAKKRIPEPKEFENCSFDWDEEMFSELCDALDFRPGDDVLVEIQDFAYLLGILSVVPDGTNVWAIPPRERCTGECTSHIPSPYDWPHEQVETIADYYAELFKPVFPNYKGVTFAVPADGPLKQYAWGMDHDYDGAFDNISVRDAFWAERDRNQGSISVLLYFWSPGGTLGGHSEFAGGGVYSVRCNSGGLEGNSISQMTWPSKVIQISGSRALLIYEKSNNSVLMVDKSSLESEWSGEISRIEIAVNDGSLLPSNYRKGAVHCESTTLGELALKIGRGTPLSAKSLEYSDEALRGEGLVMMLADSTRCQNGSDMNQSTSKESRPDVDRDLVRLRLLLASPRFIDSGQVDEQSLSFKAVVPLKSMPEGQDRYVVTPDDGKVLLISRPTGKCCVYQPARPTLISNNVFFVRLKCDVPDPFYLACWINSRYAKELLDVGTGAPLSKKALEALPVPLVSNEIEAATVQRQNDINKEIVEAEIKVKILKSLSPFAPRQAAAGEGKWREYHFGIDNLIERRLGAAWDRAVNETVRYKRADE